MIRTLTTLTSVLLDRLQTIEARVENLRLAHGCVGDACAICAVLDDIAVPNSSCRDRHRHEWRADFPAQRADASKGVGEIHEMRKKAPIRR